MSARARTVVHSDRGGHYRWPGWVALCEEAGLVRSMSAKGCSPDNAAREGFFERPKNEPFRYRDWEGAPMAEFAEGSAPACYTTARDAPSAHSDG